MVRQAADAYIISIHTPARGVTNITRTHKGDNSDFNPHSRKGSDQVRDSKREFRDFISIHTPARGVTPQSSAMAADLIFQSTLPQGE